MDFDVNQSMKAILAIVISAVAALTSALAGFGSDASIGDLDWETSLIAILAILGSGGITLVGRESRRVWPVQQLRL